MPPRIPRACRKHGCRNTTIHSSGYCPEHQNTGWENHQQGKTRHERGYGANWDKLKPLIKARDKGLCQQCLREGLVVSGTTVDHIIPKAHGGTDEPSNLELLCWPHHRKKTAVERIR
ncbi:HNH endonuclease signature motif containing protein [Yersinia enterocolitica]|jgi:5-methylcytosine-specific restriction protein A|nr:HNH endonuclease signature motif containing protein [Yersinia intermedia]EKN4096933.1 HNH endonuclease [Yersinia enterocolitica]EKN4772868.1 HNH endonuclease [Yersinia enterocolitica]EKN4912700.1 HNH endonuclease [Yersinia enterocolitica]EKN5092067.1 HNH endonuclease [Yersinia enterocolitica]EKN5098655.1 HNH endonuclease [Yersinia enterocolitica]